MGEQHPNPAFALILVQQLHQPRSYPDKGSVCVECLQVWPCHTINVIQGSAEMAQPEPPALTLAEEKPARKKK